MHRWQMKTFRAAACVAAVALATASVSSPPAAARSPHVRPGLRASLLRLHVERGERPAIVDTDGRQVLLRGVNVNAFGDYFQANAAYPAVEPMTETDWDAIAAQGFDVVRLIMSWSRLEPVRGTIDKHYLSKLHAAVDAAARRGIYTVLDMHQDAWGKYIATPAGTTCNGGSEAAIGWDGAPAWATITDGVSTCRLPGVREVAPAVFTAFQSFYTDRDGVQAELVHVWGEVARSFANDPAVAGYDLLNEPNLVTDPVVNNAQWTTYAQRAIGAIRRAERRGGGYSHIAFVEPLQLWPGVPAPADAFAAENLAFSPHLYFESISNALTIEQGMAIADGTTKALGVPMWIGEYGWWDTSTATQAKLRRYARAEDAAIASGAWWQWRQACGDPHSIGHFGGEPGDQVQYTTMRCPSRVDAGVTSEFATVLTRPYPRAAAGRMLELRSDPDARTMHLVGRVTSATTDQMTTIWVPDGGHGRPTVSGTHLHGVRTERVAGGWLVQVGVSGRYGLDVR